MVPRVGQPGGRQGRTSAGRHHCGRAELDLDKHAGGGAGQLLRHRGARRAWPEHPELVRLAGEQDGTLQVVSVAPGDTAEKVTEFFAEKGGDWPVLCRHRRRLDRLRADQAARVVPHRPDGTVVEVHRRDHRRTGRGPASPGARARAGGPASSTVVEPARDRRGLQRAPVRHRYRQQWWWWALMGLIVVVAVVVGAGSPPRSGTSDERLLRLAGRLEVPPVRRRVRRRAPGPLRSSSRGDPRPDAPGGTDDEILNFFADRYGTEVLRPRRRAVSAGWCGSSRWSWWPERSCCWRGPSGDGAGAIGAPRLRTRTSPWSPTPCRGRATGRVPARAGSRLGSGSGSGAASD